MAAGAASRIRAPSSARRSGPSDLFDPYVTQMSHILTQRAYRYMSNDNVIVRFFRKVVAHRGFRSAFPPPDIPHPCHLRIENIGSPSNLNVYLIHKCGCPPWTLVYLVSRIVSAAVSGGLWDRLLATPQDPGKQLPGVQHSISVHRSSEARLRTLRAGGLHAPVLGRGSVRPLSTSPDSPWMPPTA